MVECDFMPVIELCPESRMSLHECGEEEARRFKWIESEKAGCDLGEQAIRKWVKEHWCGYLRARWLEHLQGKQFWEELDRGDFGLLQRRFHENYETLAPSRSSIRTGTLRTRTPVAW